MKESKNKNISPLSLKLNNEEFFTPRKNDIVKLIIKGKKSQEIADEFKISINTVKNHKYGTYGGDDKLSLGIYGLMEKETGRRPYNDTDLVMMLIENGIVEVIDTHNPC